MIINLEAIDKPYSGEYEEIIFDGPNDAPKSNYWSWIKFIDEECVSWCGVFRGSIVGVETSTVFNNILVVTDSFLYMLDKKTGKLLEIRENIDYTKITLSPFGEYILATSSDIVAITNSINRLIHIEFSKTLFFVEFLKWEGYMLHIKCEDYKDSYEVKTLLLNAKTYQLLR